VRSLLERCQLPATQVDELIFGQVLTAGCGQNPARQTAARAGLPVSCPAVTVNLVCGRAESGAAGGAGDPLRRRRDGHRRRQESMSNAPI
jgi:acetyl-CoA C-acetyltransferase